MPNGKPLVATRNDLTKGQFLYSPVFDENGSYWSGFLISGSNADGTNLGVNCADYSNTTDSTLGIADNTNTLTKWGAAPVSCNPSAIYQQDTRILCMEIDFNTAGLTGSDTGRYAFVSSSSVNGAVGVAGADTICNNEKGTLPGTYRAFLGTESATAASRFDLSGAPWMRPDKVRITASVNDFMAHTQPTSGIIQTSDGGWIERQFWTGATVGGTIFTPPTTCTSFTSQSSGVNGWTWINTTWDSTPSTCITNNRLLCLQE